MATSKDTPTTPGAPVQLAVNAKDPDLLDVLPASVATSKTK